MERWQRRLPRRQSARRPRAAAAAAATATGLGRATAAAATTATSPAWHGSSSSGWAALDLASDPPEATTMLTGGSIGDVPADGPHQGHILQTEEKCIAYYQHVVVPDGYCNFTWDKVLCWPPTPADSTASQSCPQGVDDVDPSKVVLKRCGRDGRWEGLAGLTNASQPQGYTNYTNCFRVEEVQDLYIKLGGSAAEKLDIAAKTRTLEMVGLSVSLAALLVSLAIFFHFRSLRNNRTRIHKNLFIAMLMQVLIRLTLYIDRMAPSSSKGFVHTTPVLCEASYVLLEYARTAMFLWMFIEGLYLHNMVTVTVFQETFYYSLYTLIGWGVPVLMTTCWAVVTALKLDEECFRNYNLRKYFWILEGPRLGVIVLNFLFLLNIIRVLVVKLRQSRTSEMEQARKAVRAAVVLLPLLGITNLTNMMPPPLDREVWELAIWFYVTHFLTSFQGLFIACLYCFLNGEVRWAVMQRVYRYLSLRPHHFQPRRNSAYSGVYVTAGEGGAGGTAVATVAVPAAASVPDVLPRGHTVELDVGAAGALQPLQPGLPADLLVEEGDKANKADKAASRAGSASGSALALLCCRPGPLPRRPSRAKRASTSLGPGPDPGRTARQGQGLGGLGPPAETRV